MTRKCHTPLLQSILEVLRVLTLHTGRSGSPAPQFNRYTCTNNAVVNIQARLDAKLLSVSSALVPNGPSHESCDTLGERSNVEVQVCIVVVRYSTDEP